MKAKQRKEKFALKVIKGGFAPADGFTADRLRDRGLRLNDIVFAELKKPRNPKFHGLAHALGTLIAENIDSFHGLNAHRVLKRLQVEANIGCEDIVCSTPEGTFTYRVPKSLSFESMDEGEFHEVMRGMCRYIAETHWPDLNEDQIASMAGLMVSED